MKRIGGTVKKLTIRNLDAEQLARAGGGQGVCRGVFECLECGYSQVDAWTRCPLCAVGWGQVPREPKPTNGHQWL